MTIDRDKHIKAIVLMLAEMPYENQLDILAASAAVFVAKNNDPANKSTTVTVADTGRHIYKVPKSRYTKSPYQKVWNYLETIEFYDTQKSLRQELLMRFGEKETPSLTSLNRHLMANRVPRKG